MQEGSHTLVLGVGAECTYAAKEYAVLGGRHYAALDNISDIWSFFYSYSNDNILVILPLPYFGGEFCKEIIRHSVETKTSFGILPIDPGQGQNTISRLLELRRHARSYPHRIAYYCDFSSKGSPAFMQSYGNRTNKEFIKCLRQGVRAVIYHGHGNGADFRVGDHAFCVQAGKTAPEANAEDKYFLECQAGGRCRLEKKYLKGLIGPEDFHASIVIMISCWGIGLNDGLLDPRFQLMTSLFKSEHVQAAISSYRVNSNSPALAEGVAKLLDDGCSIGELTLAINQITDSDGCYICLGDPELALARSGTSLANCPKEKEPQKIEIPSNQQFINLSDDHDALPSFNDDLASLFIEDTASKIASRQLQEALIDRAIASNDISTKEFAAAIKKIAFVSEQLKKTYLNEKSGQRIQGNRKHYFSADKSFTRFLGYIFKNRGPDIYKYVLHDHYVNCEKKTGKKHSCGYELLTVRIPITMEYTTQRYLWICERCGPISDSPVSHPVLSISQSEARSIDIDFTGLPLQQGAWLTFSLTPIGENMLDSERDYPELIEIGKDSPSTFTYSFDKPSCKGLRRIAAALVFDGNFVAAQLPVML